jgi:uncharacterized protein
MTTPSRRRIPRVIWIALLGVALFEIVLPVAMALGRNTFLFFPSDAPRPEARMQVFHELEASLVRIARPDGRRLAAYDVSTSTRRAAHAPVVLFLHGNGGNIAMRAEVVEHFVCFAGVRVLMPDYSGYGGNDGSPTEGEINADALAAFDHLVAAGVAPSRIVLYGESIGGAPALYVATQRKAAGVAVQSTFSSLSSMALRKFPWMPLAALFVSGSFPSADRIATLEMPVLVVHGRSDSIVPFAEGERLFAAAKPGAEFLPIDGADHNDLFDIAGEDYLRSLGERFRRWVAR